MKKLSQLSSLAGIATNAASLLTTDLLNKATTFLVYMLIARSELGPKAFGQFSLGLALTYVFQVFATVGLPNLLTREIAKRRSKASLLTTHGIFSAFLVSGLATFAMNGVAILMQYDRDTTFVVMILSLGLMPYAMSTVFEANFRGTEQMHLIAIANVIANTFKVGGALLLLQSGLGILWIAGLLGLVRLMIFLCDWLLYSFVAKQHVAPIDIRLAKVLVSKSSTFLGIDAAIACWSIVDMLILSKLMSEIEVGLYAAATQLLQPVSLVYLSIVGSIFPGMCSRARSQPAQLHDITRWMVAFLLYLGLPTLILLRIFASDILRLAYEQPEYQQAVPVMQIASFALIGQCVTTILGHALWAANSEQRTLRIVITNLTANLVISTFTISYFGLIGAAAGTLLVSILNVVQHTIAYRSILNARPIDWQVAIPVLSAIAMLATLWVLPADTKLISASASLLVGVLVSFALLIRRFGGPTKLTQNFFSPLVS